MLEQLERDATLTFHLDGQAVLLDDYLAVRPDARGRIERLAEAGRLTLGPWYTLADELLAGDEPLVRNLLEGRRRCADLGAWLPIGYSPDAFGHPAALPTILCGFGIGSAVLWRGHAGAHDLFEWVAPDGASVLVHHLPSEGYEYGAELPTEPGAAAARWATLRAILEPRAAVPVLLILNGADHHTLQPDLSRAVGALRAAAPGYHVEIGTLDKYFAAIGTGGTGKTGETVRGELRSYGHAWALQGVHATRAGLKRRIAEGAQLLIRWAEPQAALAAVAGGADRRPLLHAAWREHLLNLSHDVLAGCVADEVAADARARARHVREQARGILVEALLERLQQSPVVARRQRERWQPTLIVVNPSPRPRGGVVEATVTLFQDDLVIGRAAARKRGGRASAPPAFRLVDPEGHAVPMQVLHRYRAYERLDSPRDYPDQDEVWAVRVAVWVEAVPALGGLSLRVVQEPEHPSTPLEVPAVPAPSTFPSILSDLDEGDTYTFEPVAGDRPVSARWGTTRVVWRGPLLGAVARSFRVGERARGVLFARADAGSSVERYVIEGENLRGEHRLRVVFPGARGEQATADMAFGPATRHRTEFDPSDFPREWPAKTGPMHRFVSAGGRTVFARGLQEYELLPDGGVAITLLRAVGQLSRGYLRARPGHAGWPTATPAAQELGRFRVELAVAPVGAREGDSAEVWERVERSAEEFHSPLAGWMLRHALAPPARLEGPALEGAGLAFKALKPREGGRGVVLRCVNVTDGPVDGAWRWPTAVTRAFRARLDETVVAELKPDPDRRTLPFAAAAREVVTVIVEP